MQKFYLLFEKYFYYLLLGLLIFIPLYPKFPLVGIARTFVAIRLEDIFIGLVVLIWLIGNAKKLRQMFSQTITQLFLLFWFIGFVSLISGVFVTQSVELKLGILHLVRRVEYMVLFLVAATSIKNLEQVKLAARVVLFGAMFVIIYGFGQLYLSFPVISTTNSEFSKGIVLYLTSGARVNSTFAGHYDLAMYLSIVLSIIAAVLFYAQNLKIKLLLALLGMVGFFLLGLTAARVSFVASLFSLSLVFWLNKKKILLILLVISSLGLVMGIPELRHRLVATVTVNLLGGGGVKYDPPPGTVNVFTPINNIPEKDRAQVLEKIKKDATDPAKQKTGTSRDIAPGEPINTTELGVYRSYGIRFDVEWPRALNAFYKNPLLGTGYSSITLATDNDYLRSLGETGLLGTLSFTLIFALLAKKMMKYRNDSASFAKYFIIGMFSATVGLLITAVFIDVFEASKIAEIYWLLMGLAWAVLVNFKFSKE